MKNVVNGPFGLGVGVCDVTGEGDIAEVGPEAGVVGRELEAGIGVLLVDAGVGFAVGVVEWDEHGTANRQIKSRT